MLDNRLNEHIRYYYDAEISDMIAKKRNISGIQGMQVFFDSETYRMLCDNSLKMWEFSPLALFDMSENEILTGDPRNSLYLREDDQF